MIENYFLLVPLQITQPKLLTRVTGPHAWPKESIMRYQENYKTSAVQLARSLLPLPTFCRTQRERCLPDCFVPMGSGGNQKTEGNNVRIVTWSLDTWWLEDVRRRVVYGQSG